MYRWPRFPRALYLTSSFLFPLLFRRLLIWCYLLILTVHSWAIRDLFKKSLLYLEIFSSINFKGSCFTLRPRSIFNWFLYRMRRNLVLTSHVFPVPFIEGAIFLQWHLEWQHSMVESQVVLSTWLCLCLLFHSIGYMITWLFSCRCHAGFVTIGLQYNLRFSVVVIPSIALSIQDVLAIWDLLHSQQNFERVCLVL